MSGKRGQKPLQVEASDPASAPTAARDSWSSDLQPDCATAAIRLATFVRDRIRRLVFACVKLYPPEVPPPTVIQEQDHFGEDTLGLPPIDVVSALAWHEEAQEVIRWYRRCRT